MMTEMLKGNFLNMVPMVVIGGWINWAFAGFLCTKVPFPLTFRFKPMLQKDVNLVSLDASWYYNKFQRINMISNVRLLIKGKLSFMVSNQLTWPTKHVHASIG